MLRKRNPYEISKEMHRWALDLKVNAIVVIKAQDFLNLTASKEHQEHIFKRAWDLKDYNKLVREGKSIVMPHLKINMDNKDPLHFGEVISHEGRHRAASLINAGEREYTIGLIIAKDYYSSRQRSFLDVPEIWTAEEHAKGMFHIASLIEVLEANVQVQYQDKPAIGNIPMTRIQIGTMIQQREAILREMKRR